MAFARTVNTHAYCFLCKSRENIGSVPLNARLQVFIKKRIFIPYNNRCCKNHLIKNRFYKDLLHNIVPISNESSIQTNELGKFLDCLSDKVDDSILGNIKECSMSDETIFALTGFTGENIFEIRDLLVTMRSSENRNVLQPVVTFLIELITGHRCIAAILNLEEKQVQKIIESVLQGFKNILPQQFGYRSITRDFLIKEVSPMAKKLHNLENNLGLICDATNLRHEKSSNAYQRKSYSGQKKTYVSLLLFALLMVL